MILFITTLCQASTIRQLCTYWLHQIEREVYENLTQLIGDADDLLTDIFIFNGILIYIQSTVSMAYIRKEEVCFDIYSENNETRPIFASLVQDTEKYVTAYNLSSDTSCKLFEAIQESRDLWIMSEKVYKKQIFIKQ